MCNLQRMHILFLRQCRRIYQRCFIKDSATGKTRPLSRVLLTEILHRLHPLASMKNNFNNGWLSMLQKACCDACRYYPGCNFWSYINDPKAARSGKRGLTWFNSKSELQKSVLWLYNWGTSPDPEVMHRTTRNGIYSYAIGRWWYR